MFRRARLVFALLAVFCLLSSAPVYAGEGGEPVVVPDPPGTGEPRSTITGVDTVFAQEYGKTSIFLRICGDGGAIQLRSEGVGKFITEVFNRTQKANGCSPSTTFRWRMIYNADPGPDVYRIYATMNDTFLSEGAFMQRAMRRECRVTGYGVGTCSDWVTPSVPNMSIDTPGNGQQVQGVINIGGWAIDAGATNGSGVSDVHVYLDGPVGQGQMLGVAQYGSGRGDVGSLFGDSRFNASGYNFNWDSNSVAAGQHTLYIYARSVISGQWQLRTRSFSVAGTTIINRAPNTPTLTAPSNGFSTTSNNITLQVQDAGDPDNGPRNFRDFFFRIEKTDGSWAQESGWRDANWSVALPSPGVYRWRAMAGDGALPSLWSNWSAFTRTSPPVTQPTGFRLPFPGGIRYTLTQGNNNGFSHIGSSAFAFDWGIPFGGSVAAAREGRVIAVRQDSTRFGCNRMFREDGNYIIIRHSDNTESRYWHLRTNSAKVKINDYVRSGQVIAETGTSGWICGVHLHYDVRRAGSNGASIPTVFLDVAENGGMPRVLRSYVSGNYLTQLLRSLVPDFANPSADGNLPPAGEARLQVEDATRYQLLLDAYDYESDALDMRVAANPDTIESTTWQSFTTSLLWDFDTAWVQYRDPDGKLSEIYSVGASPLLNQPVQASFGVPASVCQGSQIEITNESALTCPQCRWQWSIGDGRTSTLAQPLSEAQGDGGYQYDVPGTYTIGLTVTTRVASTTASRTIEVIASPNSSFHSERQGNTVTVVADDATASAWTWDFGDGATATGRSASYTYTPQALADSAVIMLKVTGANSCTSDGVAYAPAASSYRVFLPITGQ